MGPIRQSSSARWSPRRWSSAGSLTRESTRCTRTLRTGATALDLSQGPGRRSTVTPIGTTTPQVCESLASGCGWHTAQCVPTRSTNSGAALNGMDRLMRAGALLVCAVSVISIAAGCSQRTAPAVASEPTPAPGMPLPGAFGGQDPGSLISAATMPTLDRRLTVASSIAARITYLSTSGDGGSRQEVSGTVFAPLGDPPDGGWPVIAYGHAAVGIRPECAPSLDPMLLGLSNTVMGLVKAGFVVTVSDYQGLGLDRAQHPFLDATTEGYNLIDSVRAARKLIPNV